jgi:uncharacterized Rmd1/YagE family protein
MTRQRTLHDPYFIIVMPVFAGQTGMLPMTDPSTSSPAVAVKRRHSARAVLLGERIDTAGLERSNVIATTPLAFKVSEGYAVLFRYGVAVLFGLSPIEEDEVLRGVRLRVIGPFEHPDDDIATIEIDPASEEQIAPGGPISIRDLTSPHLIVISDVLAKNVALARDEREVSEVFDKIEPFAAELAQSGRSPSGRRQMLRTIGQALLVRHRMSARVAIEEKPDLLWDHPQLERLYARIADEYELRDRAAALGRKLRVIDETTRALTDLIDAERSIRLEFTIVLLIVVEIVITFYDLFFRSAR